MRFWRIFGVMLFTVFTSLASGQNVTVTGALVGNGSYSDLGSAFWAISGSANTGRQIVVRVVANTNMSSTAYLQNTYFSSLTLTSGGGVLTGNVAGPLISMTNVLRVFIQGLSMTNSSTSAVSDVGILRLEGANIVQITGCNIVGAGQSPISGAVSIFPGSSGTGSIKIENCNIAAVQGGTMANGIYALGTAGMNNSFLEFKNNSIRNCFLPAGNSHGIYVGPGNTQCEIFGNTITNTGSRTHTVGGRWCGIALDESGSNGGNVINQNTISGFSLVGAGPQSKLLPITVFNAVPGMPAVVKNNVIETMSVSGPVSGVGADSPFIGILFQGGSPKVGLNGGNRIGKTNATANILINSSSALPMDVYGIYGGGSGESDVLDSEIGGISAGNTGGGAASLHGIRCTTPSTKIADNVVGYPNAPLIVTSGDSASSLAGISVVGIEIDIRNNSVSYLKNGAPNAQTGENAGLIGIKLHAAATGAITQNNVSNNMIFSLDNEHLQAATSTLGLYVHSEPSNPVLIERLNIHTLRPSTTSLLSKVIGIYVDGGENTVQNSFVRLGMNASGGTILNIGECIGIQDIGGLNSYFHNSVFLGGNHLNGSMSSSGFDARSNTQPVTLVNNIFYNARNNLNGSGLQYIIKVNGTSALTSDHNIFYANGGGALHGEVGGVNIPNLRTWQSSTGLDSHSIDRNPNFVNPMGNLAGGNMHLGATSHAEGAGINVAAVTQDIDDQVRNALTPVDIGADAGNFQQIIASPAEIVVRGKGVIIADGDMTISRLDGTAIDSVDICSGPLEQVFWIENEGLDTLEVNGLAFIGSDTGMYQFSHLPGNLILPNAIDSFAIRFTPFRQGNHQVAVEIQTNDADEALFDFRMGGYLLQDTTKPFLSCQDTSVTASTFGVALIDLSWVLDTAYDACGVDTVTLSQLSFGCADEGIQTVLVRAYDEAGNTSTCTTSVSVFLVPFSVAVHADTTFCGYHLRCASLIDGHGAVQIVGGCAPYQYAWSSGETTLQAQHLSPGMNYVTVTDASGSIWLDSLVLDAPPPLAITLQEMVASCPYVAAGSLTLGGTGGLTCGAYRYDWNTGDTTARLDGLLPGTYSVTLTDVGGCQANLNMEVAGLFMPSPQILQHRDTLLCTAPFLSYQWYLNGQAIPYMRDPFIVPDTSGTYHVEVLHSSGCVGMSNALWMTSVRHIQQGHHLDNLVLAPNPAQGYVTLVAGDPVRTGLRVGFYDAAGRLLRKMRRPDLEDEWVIDIHDLSAGIYFLNVSANNGAYKVLRLVVQD